MAANGQVRITDIEVIYSTVLACAHTNIITETKDPTCIAAGYTAEKCADCGKVMSMVEGDLATGHSYKSKVTKDPTCTENGLKTYTCEICEASYNENISATGHSYNEGVVTTEATCTEKGEKTSTCSACGDTKTEELSMIPHNYVDGTCSLCGGKLSTEKIWQLVTDVSTLKAGDQIVIVAKDYNYALSTTQNSNNRGQATVTKTDDRVTFGNDVQILILEAGNVEGTFAFNTGSGYLYAASNSNNYLKTKVEKDENGSWLITIVDGVATIVAKGSNSRNTMQYNQSSSLFSCYASASQKAISIYKLVGGSSEPETPACEHTNTTTTTVDATCTEAGSTTVTCDDCGETLSTEVIEALGHTTDNGTCERCGEEIGGSIEPETPATTTVSKSHTDLASIAGVSTSGGSINEEEIKLDDNISIVCAKGGSTSNPAIYGESIRLYQNGATLTIKGTGMKTIVITLANNADGDGPIAVTGGTADNANAPTNYVYTITVDEGVSEVVITTKGTDKNSRLYVANIEVTYEK